MSLLAAGAGARAEDSPRALYEGLRRSEPGGGLARVQALKLERDRLQMEFTGTFYFQRPIAGGVRGALFIGQGSFRADPPGGFEQQNLKRLLDAETFASTFTTAVLRFSDDTFEHIARGEEAEGAPPAEASARERKLVQEWLKRTGSNLDARLAASILNGEAPGVFVAHFDGGKRGEFTAILDPRGRLPTESFGIDAGEKGLITHQQYQYEEVVMAFLGKDDYARGSVATASSFDLVTVPRYQITVDAREPARRCGLEVRMDVETRVEGVRALPLQIGDSLPTYWSERLKKTPRIRSASLADGTVLETWQEDWESGLTVLLPGPSPAGTKLTLVLVLEGDSLWNDDNISSAYYPWSPHQWFPSHGLGQRSTFDVTFLHRERDRVAACGVPVSEEKVAEPQPYLRTRWKMDQPVSGYAFAVGRFEPTSVPWPEDGAKHVPVEYYSLKDQKVTVKADFVAAEMMNALSYFEKVFGPYPYPRLGAVFHPRPYGQGLASLLLLPEADLANRQTFSFIAHETAHQWWGNQVGWRSYRDQWLSEGFADYSGVLYTMLRDSEESGKKLVRRMREQVAEQPRGSVVRMTDVAPLVLGHRASTRRTPGAYVTLAYAKGALVLRMLHFLYTDPSTGDGRAFFAMMRDFVDRHRDQWASTESFVAVANEHFARTPIARRYGLEDLSWFFRQWVYETDLPRYRASYRLEPGEGGKVLLVGEIVQERVPESWIMPLPVTFGFGGDQVGNSTILARGPRAPFRIVLPARPVKVELDPEMWVLSEKTSMDRAGD